VGQPVVFTLTVTNYGGTTVTNLVATLAGGDAVTIGAPTPVSVALLPPGGAAVFTWTVTPMDARGLTLYANASGTTVGAAGDVTVSIVERSAVVPGVETPESKKAFAFPSPADASVRIAYTMAEAGTVTIRIYNRAGELAATVEDTRAAGVQSSALTTADLAPGVYYILLARKYGSGSSDKADVAKFVVTH
jgi:hypothetical protein